MTQAFIFLNEGFEEIEAVTVIDVLRRGGVTAKFVSLSGERQVRGSRDVVVAAELLYPEFLQEYADVKEEAALILPGGPGTKHYREAAGLKELLRGHHESGGIIAAICAAPTILDEWGLLDGRTAVCYPALKLVRAKTGSAPVEIDGNIITSLRPAATMLFAVEILRALKGSEVADEIADNLLMKPRGSRDAEGGVPYGA